MSEKKLLLKEELDALDAATSTTDKVKEALAVETEELRKLKALLDPELRVVPDVLLVSLDACIQKLEFITNKYITGYSRLRTENEELRTKYNLADSRQIAYAVTMDVLIGGIKELHELGTNPDTEAEDYVPASMRVVEDIQEALERARGLGKEKA